MTKDRKRVKTPIVSSSHLVSVKGARVERL